MQTVTLSENAVAVLRFRVKGWPWKVNDRNRAAFEELVVAGIMEPDGPDYRFTAGGWERREEILRREEERLLEMEPPLPERIDLSKEARKALARYVAGDREVTDANREAYRELARAGIMVSVGTFARGDDCVFRLTYRGWQRRHDLQRTLPRFSASAIARNLALAVSRIARVVSAAR